MKTGTKSFLLQILVLTYAWSAAAQSQTLEIRAAGEHRMASGETSETARQLALIASRRNVLSQAAARLQETAEVKAIPFKSNQIDAFLPSLVEVEEGATQAEPVAGGAVYRSEVLVRVSPAQIARRMDQLRKDPNAVTGLMEMWKQSEELDQQLAELIGRGGVRSASELNLLITRLNVKRVVAQVYASLAKTEESPASAREPSPKGRQRARQLAEIAVTMGPNWPETHLAMGDVLMDSDLPPAAEAEYRQALLLGGLTSGSAHIKLADALRAEGKLPEAAAELREALRIDPKSPGAHTDLGYVLGAQQNTSESISEYQEALRLDPDFIEAHNYLAVAFARQGRIPDAVGEFREIVRVDPDSVLGYYNLGIALADMEKDEESAEAFRQAVRINPNHFNARYDLAELFRLEGKFDEAVKQFREYLRLAPDTPQNQRNIGRARDFVQTHANP